MKPTYRIFAVCFRCPEKVQLTVVKEGNETDGDHYLTFKRVHTWYRGGSWDGLCDNCHDAFSVLKLEQNETLSNFMEFQKGGGDDK